MEREMRKKLSNALKCKSKLDTKSSSIREYKNKQKQINKVRCLPLHI